MQDFHFTRSNNSEVGTAILEKIYIFIPLFISGILVAEEGLKMALHEVLCIDLQHLSALAMHIQDNVCHHFSSQDRDTSNTGATTPSNDQETFFPNTYNRNVCANKNNDMQKETEITDLKEMIRSLNNQLHIEKKHTEILKKEIESQKKKAATEKCDPLNLKETLKLLKENCKDYQENIKEATDAMAKKLNELEDKRTTIIETKKQQETKIKSLEGHLKKLRAQTKSFEETVVKNKARHRENRHNFKKEVKENAMKLEEVRKERAAASGATAKEREELEKAMNETKSEIEEMTKKKEKQEHDLKRTKEEVDAAAKELGNLNKRNSQLQEEKIGLEVRTRSLQYELTVLKGLEKTMNKTKSEIEEMTPKKEKQECDLNKTKEKMDLAANELVDFEKRKHQLQEEKIALEARTLSLQYDLTMLKEQKDILEKEKKEKKVELVRNMNAFQEEVDKMALELGTLTLKRCQFTKEVEAEGAELKVLEEELKGLRQRSKNDKHTRKQFESNLEKNKLQQQQAKQQLAEQQQQLVEQQQQIVEQQQQREHHPFIELIVGNVPIGYNLENLLPSFYQFGFVNREQSRFLLEPTIASPGRVKIIFGNQTQIQSARLTELVNGQGRILIENGSYPRNPAVLLLESS